jgi:beta-glucosidase
MPPSAASVTAQAPSSPRIATNNFAKTVQLYIGDPIASRSRPVRELKGFQKIALQPGEERVVNFGITADDLRFFRAESLATPEHVFEPGVFTIQIGPSSDMGSSATIEWQAYHE